MGIYFLRNIGIRRSDFTIKIYFLHLTTIICDYELPCNKYSDLHKDMDITNRKFLLTSSVL